MQNQILGFFIVTSIALGALCGVQWHQARQHRNQAVHLRTKLEDNAIEMDGLQSNLQTLKSDQAQIQKEQTALSGLVAKLMQTTNTLTREMQSAQAEMAAAWPRLNDPSSRAWASAIGTNLNANPTALELFRLQQSWLWKALGGVLAEDMTLPASSRIRLRQRLAEDRLVAIRARLAAANHPLRDAQEQPLREAMSQAQEKKALPDGNTLPNAQGEARSVEARFQTHLRLQEIEGRLLLDQARNFLDAEQLETLAAFHTNDVKAQQLSLDWVRELARNAGGIESQR